MTVTAAPWEASERAGPLGETPAPLVVTVITPTIPSRHELLAEAAMSVHRQTLAGVTHSILLDAHGDGPAATRNELLRTVRTPYVAFLDDDDLLEPEHLEVLLDRLELSDASVSYSYCNVIGPAAVSVPRPPRDGDVWRLMERGRNVIPITVLARTDAIRAGGCFYSEDRYEDYALWMRLRALGHDFALEPRVTWTYRMLGENRTHA